MGLYVQFLTDTLQKVAKYASPGLRLLLVIQLLSGCCLEYMCPHSCLTPGSASFTRFRFMRLSAFQPKWLYGYLWLTAEIQIGGAVLNKFSVSVGGLVIWLSGKVRA